MPEWFSSSEKKPKKSKFEAEVKRRLKDELGLPLIENIRIRDWIFDGALNWTSLLIEIDGAYWHGPKRPDNQARDAAKERWAKETGYTILRIAEQDYKANPAAELLKIVAAYVAAPRDGPPHIREKSDTRRGRRSDYGSWHDRFLAAFRESGIILDGCEAAGVTRQTVRQHFWGDIAFRKAYMDAKRDAADERRRIRARRAREQSDRLLEAEIVELDPRPEQDFLGPIIAQYLDMTKLSDRQLDRLEAGDDVIQILIDG